jgi:hypothetical protein
MLARRNKAFKEVVIGGELKIMDALLQHRREVCGLSGNMNGRAPVLWFLNIYVQMDWTDHFIRT